MRTLNEKWFIRPSGEFYVTQHNILEPFMINLVGVVDHSLKLKECHTYLCFYRIMFNYFTLIRVSIMPFKMQVCVIQNLRGKIFLLHHHFDSLHYFKCKTNFLFIGLKLDIDTLSFQKNIQNWINEIKKTVVALGCYYLKDKNQMNFFIDTRMFCFKLFSYYNYNVVIKQITETILCLM